MNICMVGIMSNRPPWNKVRGKSSRQVRSGVGLSLVVQQVSSTQRFCALLRAWQEPALPVNGLTGSALGDICFGHVLCKVNIGGSKSQGLLGSCFSALLNSNKKWFIFSPVQSGLWVQQLSNLQMKRALHTIQKQYRVWLFNTLIKMCLKNKLSTSCWDCLKFH